MVAEIPDDHGGAKPSLIALPQESPALANSNPEMLKFESWAEKRRRFFFNGSEESWKPIGGDHPFMNRISSINSSGNAEDEEENDHDDRDANEHDPDDDDEDG